MENGFSSIDVVYREDLRETYQNVLARRRAKNRRNSTIAVIFGMLAMVAIASLFIR
jgi:hypothetical protein